MSVIVLKHEKVRLRITLIHIRRRSWRSAVAESADHEVDGEIGLTERVTLGRTVLESFHLAHLDLILRGTNFGCGDLVFRCNSFNGGDLS